MLEDNYRPPTAKPYYDRDFESVDLYKGRNVTVSYPGSKYEFNGTVTSVLTFVERHDVRIEFKMPNGDIGIIQIATRKPTTNLIAE